MSHRSQDSIPLITYTIPEESAPSIIDPSSRSVVDKRSLAETGMMTGGSSEEPSVQPTSLAGLSVPEHAPKVDIHSMSDAKEVRSPTNTFDFQADKGIRLLAFYFQMGQHAVRLEVDTSELRFEERIWHSASLPDGKGWVFSVTSPFEGDQFDFEIAHIRPTQGQEANTKPFDVVFRNKAFEGCVKVINLPWTRL